MSVKVEITISDVTPTFTCSQEGCGQRFFGDSVLDAFRNYWWHVAKEHGDEI